MFSIFKCGSNVTNSRKVYPIITDVVNDDEIEEPTVIRHIKVLENRQVYNRQNTVFTFDRVSEDKK